MREVPRKETKTSEDHKEDPRHPHNLKNAKTIAVNGRSWFSFLKIECAKRLREHAGCDISPGYCCADFRAGGNPLNERLVVAHQPGIAWRRRYRPRALRAALLTYIIVATQDLFAQSPSVAPSNAGKGIFIFSAFALASNKHVKRIAIFARW